MGLASAAQQTMNIRMSLKRFPAALFVSSGMTWPMVSTVLSRKIGAEAGVLRGVEEIDHLHGQVAILGLGQEIILRSLGGRRGSSGSGLGAVLGGEGRLGGIIRRPRL